MSITARSNDIQLRNTALTCLGLAAGMLGLAYAAVPLIADDPDIGSLDGITLSYTYFPPKGASPAQPAAR